MKEPQNRCQSNGGEGRDQVPPSMQGDAADEDVIRSDPHLEAGAKRSQYECRSNGGEGSKQEVPASMLGDAAVEVA